MKNLFLLIICFGIHSAAFAQIISGIDEADDVITAPYSAISKKLKNNSPVEVVDLKDLFKTAKE